MLVGVGEADTPREGPCSRADKLGLGVGFHQLRAYLTEVRKWDRDALSGQERWTHDLVDWYFQTQIDLMSFDWAPAWLPTAAGIARVDVLGGLIHEYQRAV